MAQENLSSMCCRNELNLCKLCVEKVKAEHLCACAGNIDALCSQSMQTGSLSGQSAVLNDLCVSGKVTASQLLGDMVNANHLCAKSATINQLCVDNLTAGNWLPCTKYRATVNYSVNTTYTLGSLFLFNNILDDPNNNVSLVPHTSYTAPLSGYYMMSFKVNITNVQPTSGPVLGIPIANPEIYVNGVLAREAYSPFLAFFDTQKVILDSLISLNAGDVLTLKYNILEGAGASVVGTVDILGSGIEDGNSFFKIIFLSGLCSGDQPMCAQCPTVTVPCLPFTNPCPRVCEVPGSACSPCAGHNGASSK